MDRIFNNLRSPQIPQVSNYTLILLSLIVVSLLIFLGGACFYKIGKSKFGEVEVEGIKEGINIVCFHAPWCPACKAFMPTYLAFVDMMKDKDKTVNVISINGDEERELSKKYNIKGFPTILAIVKKGNDEKVVEFPGPRSLEGLHAFSKQFK